jgi:hypothetical protein
MSSKILFTNILLSHEISQFLVILSDKFSDKIFLCVKNIDVFFQELFSKISSNFQKLSSEIFVKKNHKLFVSL